MLAARTGATQYTNLRGLKNRNSVSCVEEPKSPNARCARPGGSFLASPGCWGPRALAEAVPGLCSVFTSLRSSTRTRRQVRAALVQLDLIFTRSHP